MQIFEQTFYHNLPSGIRLVHRRTASPVAYVGVMVGAGTRDEDPSVNGMAHYIEHCVFKGTARHTARQLIANIEGIGGEINAYTTKEETTFYAATPVAHVRLTLGLIAEMVLNPTFPKQETDKERTVILDEIESYNDSPSELIYDDFENLLFGGHPLEQPILGTRRTLRHLSSKPEYAREWMQANYRPERMVVFCQGNVSPEAFFRMAEQSFDPRTTLGQLSDDSRLAVSSPSVRRQFAVSSPSVKVRTAYVPKNDMERSRSFHRHTHQTHAMLGSTAFPLGHPQQLHLYLLNNIVGGGSLNSRLNMSLREARGLVYTVESTYTPLSDTGYWCTYFACDPEHFDECLRLTMQELERLRQKPLSETARRKALLQLQGQMAIAAQNQENNALSMAKSVLYFGYAPTWEETYERVAKTTAADLQQAAQTIFDPDRLYLLSYR